MLKRIFSNTISAYSLKVVQLLLNLIAIPIFIKYLGAEGFALITFANVFVGYFYILDFGLTNGVTKYIAQYLATKDYNKVNQVINSTLFVFFILGSFIFLFIYSIVSLGLINYFDVSDNLKHESISVFIIAGLISLVSWPKMILESVYKGLQDFTTLNFLLGIGRIFSVAFSILATAWFDISIKYIFILFNLDKIFLFFIFYYLLINKLTFWKFKMGNVSFVTLKEILSFSGWVMLANLSAFLEYQIDYFIIVSMLGLSFVTDYTVIFYLFHFIQQISGLASSAILPAVSAIQAKKDYHLINKFIYKGSKYHNMVYVPLSMVLYIISEPFINLWVGVYYLKYLWIVKLSILFQVIWQSNSFLGNIYYGVGKSKKLGLLALIIGLSNLSLSLFLVDKLGLIGVILGTIIVGVCSVPFEFYWIFPDLNIVLKKYIKSLYLNVHIPLIGILLMFYPFDYYIRKIDSWFLLLFVAILLIIIFYTFTYFLLDKHDKSYISSNMKSLLNRETT